MQATRFVVSGEHDIRPGPSLLNRITFSPVDALLETFFECHTLGTGLKALSATSGRWSLEQLLIVSFVR